MALQNSGAISLNQIHVEAGGTSGTQVSINDADVRGLIGKASGAQSSFSNFYGASAYAVDTDVFVYSRSFSQGQSNTQTYGFPLARTVFNADKSKAITYLQYRDSGDVTASSRGGPFVDIFLYNTSSIGSTSFIMSRRVVNSGDINYYNSTSQVNSYWMGYEIIALKDTFIVIADNDLTFSDSVTETVNGASDGTKLHLICFNYSFQEQWRQAHTITGNQNQRGMLPNNMEIYDGTKIMTYTSTNTNSNPRRFGFGTTQLGPDRTPVNSPIYDGSHIYLLGHTSMLLLKLDPDDGSIVAKTAFTHSTADVKPASIAAGSGLYGSPLAQMVQSTYDEDQLLISTYSNRFFIVNKSNLSISTQGGSSRRETASANDQNTDTYTGHNPSSIADDPSNGDVFMVCSSVIPGTKLSINTNRLYKFSRTQSWGTTFTNSGRRDLNLGAFSSRVIGVDSSYVYCWLSHEGGWANGIERFNKSNLTYPTNRLWTFQPRNDADTGWIYNNNTSSENGFRYDNKAMNVLNDGSTVSYEMSFGAYHLWGNPAKYATLNTGSIATDSLANAFTSTSATNGYSGYRMTLNNNPASNGDTFMLRTNSFNANARTNDFGGWTAITVNSTSSSSLGYWSVHNDTLPVKMGGSQNTNPPLKEFGTVT